MTSQQLQHTIQQRKRITVGFKFSTMRTLFFVVLLIVSFPVFASTTYFLKGTLGKSEIYMKFEDFTMDYPNDEPTIVDVRYFYKMSLRDIVLRGEKSENNFTFYFQQDGEKFKEKFFLTMMKDGTFKGYWESEKGKKLKVNLNPIATDQLEHPFSNQPFIQKLKKTDPYEYMRSFFLKFKKDSVSNYNSNSFQWVSETHARSFGFFLGESFDSLTRKKMHEPLEKILLENALSQLSCASEWDYNTGNGIEYTIELTYLDRNLLGFEISAGWDCGGAHPDFGTEGYLFNLSTGQNYDIDEIVAFGKVVVYNDGNEGSDNFSEFSEYRDTYFAPQLVALMREIYHIKTPTEDADDPCDYTDPSNWDFPSWIFKEDGIVFIPIFARVARACETTEFIIPFETLKKFKNPSFPFDFPSR